MDSWPGDLADRVRPLNAQRRPRRPADYVLAWARSSLRANDNPLLDAAIALGNDLGLPVVVYVGLYADYPHASDRLHGFALGAARDLQRHRHDQGLRCITHVADNGAGVLSTFTDKAAALLTDDDPILLKRHALPDLPCPIIAVDTARLVPVRMLPEGLNSTPAFRKAHTALRATYEAEQPVIAPDCGRYDGPLPVPDIALGDMSDGQIATLIADCAIDHSIPASTAFQPTVAAADQALATFVDHRLAGYAARRNNAADPNGVSRLSPYLHVGLIGPRRITAAVRAADAPANAKWKYLDELLTWREYFHYLAHHRADPTSMDHIPDRARQSLLDHASDTRPQLYSLADLLFGRTADETWNAAQRQWLITGYMHNNLRMYWGKQIIKWTRDPQTAWATALYLNDRLSLDGQDPATYGNMAWVFGAAKPAWREQDIYGWVAPKTDRAIRKRPGAAAWLQDWANRDMPAVSVPEGYPHDIF